jgi:hypothetical protein
MYKHIYRHIPIKTNIYIYHQSCVHIGESAEELSTRSFIRSEVGCVQSDKCATCGLKIRCCSRLSCRLVYLRLVWAAILIIPSELGCVYILLVIYITKKNIYIACDTAIRKLCLIWYWLISVF